MGTPVHEISALLQVRVQIVGSQFDRSVMPQPEFRLATCIVFRTVHHYGTPLQASWRVCRSFDEFQGLDAQLRRAFPQDMKLVAPPPPHRRRTWLHRHRRATFLAKRCAELNTYLERLVRSPHLRLTRFLDPRAPLVLRCFCNFDAGLLTARATVVRNPFRDWVLTLDYRNGKASPSSTVDDRALRPQKEREEQDRRRSMTGISQPRRVSRPHPHADDAKLDELQANLIDDKSRDFVMCVKYECACRVAPFRVVHTTLLRMLHLRGFKQVYAPPEGAYTALYCIVYTLQQLNDLDKRLYDALTGSVRPNARMDTPLETATNHAQLSVVVDLLHQTLANYGLLHAPTLAPHFHTTTVDLKRRLHDFKSRQQLRVGAIELVLLATMLNLSIVLVSNDHEGSERQILPLPEFQPLRLGGRISLTLGYILPTLTCVNGFYLVAARENIGAISVPRVQGTNLHVSLRQRQCMWQGIDELDRQFMAEIERTLETGTTLEFDFDVAESLNSAILDAVWDDCHHNLHRFHLFQHQARAFGKGCTSARSFLHYLEVAFGLDGASYLVDFLLHVLPEAALCTQLQHVRWRRLHRHLATRVLPAFQQDQESFEL